jgi:hypothetical protein
MSKLVIHAGVGFAGITILEDILLTVKICTLFKSPHPGPLLCPVQTLLKGEGDQSRNLCQ